MKGSAKMSKSLNLSDGSTEPPKNENLPPRMPFELKCEVAKKVAVVLAENAATVNDLDSIFRFVRCYLFVNLPHCDS